MLEIQRTATPRSRLPFFLCSAWDRVSVTYILVSQAIVNTGLKPAALHSREVAETPLCTISHRNSHLWQSDAPPRHRCAAASKLQPTKRGALEATDAQASRTLSRAECRQRGLRYLNLSPRPDGCAGVALAEEAVARHTCRPALDKVRGV